MVQLVGPLGSSEARGKLGGLVYCTTRGINYARTLVKPANENTPRRLAIRALAKACTTQWQTISDTLRTAWNEYAAAHPERRWTGKATRSSGYNWFIRTNVRLLDLGGSIISTPPYRANEWPILSLSATPGSDSIALTWSLPSGAPSTTLTVDIWISRPLSPGRAPKIEDAKHRKYQHAEDGSATITPLAGGHYGIFARTIDEATGLASPWSLVYADISHGTPETFGPYLTTAGSDLADGAEPWVDINHIFVDDSNYGYCDCDPDLQSNTLLLNAFAASIPVGETIAGLEVTTKYHSADPGTIHMQLAYAGAAIGSERNHTTLDSGSPVLTLGSPTDLWGAVLTPAIINAITFGVRVWQVMDNANEIDIFYVKVTVHGLT